MLQISSTITRCGRAHRNISETDHGLPGYHRTTVTTENQTQYNKTMADLTKRNKAKEPVDTHDVVTPGNTIFG